MANLNYPDGQREFALMVAEDARKEVQALLQYSGRVEVEARTHDWATTFRIGASGMQQAEEEESLIRLKDAHRLQDGDPVDAWLYAQFGVFALAINGKEEFFVVGIFVDDVQRFP